MPEQTTTQTLLLDMMDAFQIRVNDPAVFELPEDEDDLAWDVFFEEVEELTDYTTEENFRKELADVIVTVYQLGLRRGYDVDADVREVVRSNMSKLGPNGELVRREDGKILKGEFYFEPNMKQVRSL